MGGLLSVCALFMRLPARVGVDQTDFNICAIGCAIAHDDYGLRGFNKFSLKAMYVKMSLNISDGTLQYR